MMKLSSALATAAIATGLLIGGATAASAYTPGDIIPGSGYAGLAGNGNSGTDAFGNAWNWGTTSGGSGVAAGLAAWGTPGLGDGYAVYEGSQAADDFEVSFVNPKVVINDTASLGAGGYNEETRFDVCSPTCVEWTPVFVGTHEVDFYAPTGTSLKDGQSYFVNVTFNENTGNHHSGVNGYTTGFSAVFTSHPVPEPATWAMMLIGFGGIGGAMRIARRKQAAVAA